MEEYRVQHPAPSDADRATSVGRSSPLTAAIPLELRRAVEELAQAEERSLSAIVRRALTAYVEKKAA